MHAKSHMVMAFNKFITRTCGGFRIFFAVFYHRKGMKTLSDDGFALALNM